MNSRTLTRRVDVAARLERWLCLHGIPYTGGATPRNWSGVCSLPRQFVTASHCRLIIVCFLNIMRLTVTTSQYTSLRKLPVNVDS